MPKKEKTIPLNTFSEKYGKGIFIARASVKDFRLFEQFEEFEEVKHAHRDDYHLFFLQEKGTTSFEVDFQKHKLKPASVMYIQPNQVHRILDFENVTVTIWAISNEDLNPEYLNLLEEIAPAKPLSLKKEALSITSEAISLCLKLSARENETLYYPLLKDSCNTLVALIVSQYLGQSKSTDNLSRFDVITKAFKAILERNFTTAKKPAEYAQALHISIPYLNECVKHSTGYSVSYHIQQRIILEAKRLLYHSNSSVKEIANELGYEDYPYFSRLFTKVTGMSALTFRNKNLD